MSADPFTRDDTVATSYRGRRFLITINYPGIDDQMFQQISAETKEIATIHLSEGTINYAAGVAERGNECGTLHLHIMVHFTASLRFRRVKRIMIDWGGGADISPNVQPQRGNNRQCHNYIYKDDGTNVHSAWEVGELSGNGGSSQRGRAVQMIMDGQSMISVAHRYPAAYVNAHAGLRALQHEMIQPVAVPDREVHWIWGPAGTGKTFTAWREARQACGGPDELAPLSSVVAIGLPQGNNIEFRPDEYDPAKHEAVIFDELRPQSVNYGVLLRLFDVYPFAVDARYAKKSWNVKYIYVTSPFPPSDFNGREELAQLTRRITSTRHFTDLYVAPAVDGSDDSAEPAVPAATDGVGELG